MARTGELRNVLLASAFALLPVPPVVHAQEPAQAKPLPAPAAAQAEDWQLPGTFSQGTSLADLQARFGTDNLRKVMPAADAYHCEVILFPDDPACRAHAFFYDCEKLDQLRSIEVRDRVSRWRGKGGVHVGMSFAELRERNGKPFGFSGFDQDGTGTAHDQWSPAIGDDATLGKLEKDDLQAGWDDLEALLDGRSPSPRGGSSRPCRSASRRASTGGSRRWPV